TRPRRPPPAPPGRPPATGGRLRASRYPRRVGAALPPRAAVAASCLLLSRSARSVARTAFGSKLAPAPARAHGGFPLRFAGRGAPAASRAGGGLGRRGAGGLHGRPLTRPRAPGYYCFCAAHGAEAFAATRGGAVW